MDQENFECYEALEMVDRCLNNYRQSQLDQFQDTSKQGIIVSKVSGSVLFACYPESPKFAAFLLSHNVYGLWLGLFSKIWF